MFEEQIKVLEARYERCMGESIKYRKEAAAAITEKYFLLGKNSVYNDMKKDLR